MPKISLDVRVWRVFAFGVMLAVAFLLYVWLERSAWYPPVGTFIGILALLGVLLPLSRDIAKIGKGEKAVWTAVLFALVLLEIRSEYKDRAHFEQEFETTTAEFSNNINTLTGGDSACYLAAINTAQPSRLFFIHIGRFPLYSVEARVVELSKESQFTPGTLQGITIPVGDMIPGHGNVLALPASLIISSDYFNANIFFTARNGDWFESLRERRIDGEMVSAMRVSGRFTSFQTERTVCERIDPKFPKKSNGDIDDDFRAGPKVPRCP